jgi:nicotinamidase-related amidase
MPITTLDPVTALVVIDLQVGIAAMPTTPYSPAAVIANAAKLARGFRTRELPVALVNVAGMSPGRADVPRPAFAFPPNWTDLVPELERQPSDYLVTKHSRGAFYGTSLDLHLRRRGVTQIVICGISTSAGVESTARDAHDRGYHLTFVVDAMADSAVENHTHAIERIFPRLGETGTTADVLAKLG